MQKNRRRSKLIGARINAGDGVSLRGPVSVPVMLFQLAEDL